MNKSSFFIVGKHAVTEALRNEKRKVLRIFLTEESKKNIHRDNPKRNLLKDIKIYLGPSIKSCCYEIKSDVAKYFDQKFIIKNNQKLFLDLESKINDDLFKMGVKHTNIFMSNICTYENKNFCSYRRDYNKSGRMYSIIG